MKNIKTLLTSAAILTAITQYNIRCRNSGRVCAGKRNTRKHCNNRNSD